MAKQAVVKQLESKQANRNESSRAREEIAALAYSLWQARGCPEGSPEDDWFNAELAEGTAKRKHSKVESTRVSTARQRHWPRSAKGGIDEHRNSAIESTNRCS